MPLRQYVVTYTARFTVDDTSVMSKFLGTPVFGEDGEQVADDQEIDAKAQVMGSITAGQVPMSALLRQYLGATFHSVEPVLAEVLAERLPAARLTLPGSTNVEEDVPSHANGEPGADARAEG